MYSLIESAKLNGLNPQFYLADLLARIADHPARHIADPSSLELAARRHRSRCRVSAGASTERLLINRHWAVVNDDIRKPRIRSQFDMITCISVIEHIKEHAAAFQSMIRLLQPGGHLVLTTPYNEQGSVPNVLRLAGCGLRQVLALYLRSTSRQAVDNYLRLTGAELVRQEYWDFWSGEVWARGTELPVARQVSATDRHQLTCMLIRQPG